VSEPLKLMATDEEGLQVISACLQDSLTRLADMSFQRRRKRFVVMLSRYRWEDRKKRKTDGERVRAGIHFDGISNVRAQGLDQTDTGGLLDLLALTIENSEHGYDISMIFGGGGAIKLEAECIDVYLSDMGATWETDNLPDHQLDSDL
jgi:Protein of unknown function (DUF2948)